MVHFGRSDMDASIVLWNDHPIELAALRRAGCGREEAGRSEDRPAGCFVGAGAAVA